MSPPETSPIFSTLYFAYGSNLSLSQMSSRCPSSLYHSFGVLKGYKWIIGPRGYANVVKRQNQGDEESGEKDEEVVYGILYQITKQDEVKLGL
jgi:gamma-glutamylcyclotransferase